MIKIGDTFKTKCGMLEVVSYKSTNSILVRFEDGTEIIGLAKNIKNGDIKNPNYPNICDVGYFGIGNYSVTKNKKLYFLWNNMLKRCYDTEFQKKHPTYKGCEVAKRWHNFQNFAADVEQMVGYDKLSEGWQLDKDIIYRDNIRYSRKTCCLVPQPINSLLLKSEAKRGEFCIGVNFDESRNKYRASCKVQGNRTFLGRFATEKEAFLVYKETKEKEIKRVAKLYKDEIDQRAYTSLLNYEVKIND